MAPGSHWISSPTNSGQLASYAVVQTYWLAADRQTLKRINLLIDDALSDPVAGIGKPELLRHMLARAWSRRIAEEHRLVYLVDGDDLIILQARFHYE